MDALLIAIVTWLSANTELPANYQLPTIRYATTEEIMQFRYGAFSLSERQRIAAAQAIPPDQRNSVVAVYDDKKREILLPSEWSPATASALSVLVHEMVHHLQYSAQIKFACPQEREATAYKAQEKWLQLFGKSLESEFGIDPFTVLVNSNCQL